MKRKIEINEYEYNDIKIMVEINYCTHKMSIVDYVYNEFKPKQFMFAGREKEYSRGWLNVLGAISFAIAEATKLLEEDSNRQELKTYEYLKAIDEVENSPEIIPNKKKKINKLLKKI